jgi:hypothetical protein
MLRGAAVTTGVLDDEVAMQMADVEAGARGKVKDVPAMSNGVPHGKGDGI